VAALVASKDTSRREVVAILGKDLANVTSMGLEAIPDHVNLLVIKR
jgi:hypothetical protein